MQKDANIVTFKLNENVSNFINLKCEYNILKSKQISLNVHVRYF